MHEIISNNNTHYLIRTTGEINNQINRQNNFCLKHVCLVLLGNASSEKDVITQKYVIECYLCCKNFELSVFKCQYIRNPNH